MQFFQHLMLSVALVAFAVMPALAAGEGTSEGPKIKWVQGPLDVTLGENLATLQLPEQFVFADAEDTRHLMEAMHNTVTEQEIGLVTPADEHANWYILFEYDPMGYVKDDEADKIDAEAILNGIKENTEAQNEENKKAGLPGIHVVGWQDPPHYDKATHNLVWSLLARDDEGGEIINYNTRILGREGVTSVTLVVEPEHLEAIKPELSRVLDSYRYQEGKRYSDFIEGKDKIAAVGLTALVAGGVGAAAAKTGLLGKIFAPLLLLLKKFWIILAALVGGLFSRIKSFFKRSD